MIARTQSDVLSLLLHWRVFWRGRPRGVRQRYASYLVDNCVLHTVVGWPNAVVDAQLLSWQSYFVVLDLRQRQRHHHPGAGGPVLRDDAVLRRLSLYISQSGRILYLRKAGGPHMAGLPPGAHSAPWSPSASNSASSASGGSSAGSSRDVFATESVESESPDTHGQRWTRDLRTWIHTPG